MDDFVSKNDFIREHIYFRFLFSSVTRLCPTLCNPRDCSTPGFLVHHQLPERVQTHIH